MVRCLARERGAAAHANAADSGQGHDGLRLTFADKSPHLRRVLESNATSDPALARLIEVVDDQSDTARLMRAHMGTFDSGDVLHLREAAEAALRGEAALKGAERSAFETLRAQGASRACCAGQRACSGALGGAARVRRGGG